MSTPQNNITNDVAFTGGNLTNASSAVVEGLSAAYKSNRMTVLVWDFGDYTRFVVSTTAGVQEVGWLSSADVTAPEVSSAADPSLIRGNGL